MKRFEVGLEPSAAARVGTSDRQCNSGHLFRMTSEGDPLGFCHSFNASTVSVTSRSVIRAEKTANPSSFFSSVSSSACTWTSLSFASTSAAVLPADVSTCQTTVSKHEQQHRHQQRRKCSKTLQAGACEQRSRCEMRDARCGRCERENAM